MTPVKPSSLESDTPKDALLLRLATEVRHALHHVLGSVEIVSEEFLSPQQTKHLSRCRESAHELLRIVNDVSELADSNPLAESSSPFELLEMLQEFTTLVGIRAKRKGLDLQWNIDRQIPRLVLGHRQAIENVLYRIVDNSVKFTERGGITIEVNRKDSDPHSGGIVIEVSDTGPGIAQDVLEDLRRPVSDSRNRGLGLRLARKQLAEMGGHLEVASSDARGTTVAIVFSVEIPSPDSNGELAPSDQPRGDKLRLLVAEDSDDSFAVFDTFVKNEGHHVLRAVDGASAVEMFKKHKFDLVVMDINMPVMDGYTATRTIREWETQQGRARLPILLLSAEDGARQLRIGSSVGCSGYLTKPTPKRELLCALRHYAGAAPTTP